MESRGTLSRKEACAYIGISMPILDTLLRRADRPIPSFRIGRRIFIPVDGLNAWLAEEAQRGVVGA
ncbi:MAG: DNA-binding protein [Oscillospiraceae bacterium]|nr:DNA-binding protein [Oscillospiraceae bacterium]